MAATRSVLLAAAALVLAGCRQRAGLKELSWLAYPLLVLGGLKLVVDDLPNGTAGSLFLTFAFYGAALIATPRLLRTGPADEGGGPA